MIRMILTDFNQSEILNLDTYKVINNNFNTV